MPAFFNTGRRSGSRSASALEMPWRTAPACPERPPPLTVARMSYCSVRSVTWKGWLRIMRSTGRAKYCSPVRPLTVSLPLPSVTQTRATASLRLPVA